MGCALAVNTIMFALTIKEFCAVEEAARRHLNSGIKEKNNLEGQNKFILHSLF